MDVRTNEPKPSSNAHRSTGGGTGQRQTSNTSTASRTSTISTTSTTSTANPTSTTSEHRAPARTWVGLVILLLPALLVSMDISILFVASPALTQDLAPTSTQWLWMMDIYSFVMAGLLVTMGGVADRIGRRRLLLIGAVVFGAASLMLAQAASPGVFIAGRALLGIGAATLAPSTLALIRSMFLGEIQRRRAIAAWTVAFTGGAVGGPMLGGLLLEYFWWGSVFLINLPVMALLLIGAPLLVPESRNPDATGFDLPGAALSLAGIVGVVFAAKQLAEEHLDLLTVGGLVAGAGLIAMFIRRQRRTAHPLLDLTLFRRAAFSASVCANALAALAMVGLGLLAFTYLQAVHGLSALMAALVALPTLAGTFTGATLVSALGHRLRPGLLLPAGLLVAAAGMAAIALLDHQGSLTTFIAGYTVLTLGVGAVSTLTNDLILSTAPAHRAGAAASVSETGMVLGEALGIAAFGTISALVYRSQMNSAVPTGLPDHLLPQAIDTIGGAIAVAGELPGDQRAELLAAASQSFTTGLSAVTGVAAVVLVLTALVAAIALRRVRHQP